MSWVVKSWLKLDPSCFFHVPRWAVTLHPSMLVSSSALVAGSLCVHKEERCIERVGSAYLWVISTTGSWSVDSTVGFGNVE